MWLKTQSRLSSFQGVLVRYVAKSDMETTFHLETWIFRHIKYVPPFEKSHHRLVVSGFILVALMTDITALKASCIHCCFLNKSLVTSLSYLFTGSWGRNRFWCERASFPQLWCASGPQQRCNCGAAVVCRSSCWGPGCWRQHTASTTCVDGPHLDHCCRGATHLRARGAGKDFHPYMYV